MVAPFRPPSLLRAFLDSETAAGYLLIAAALLALIIANSPLASTYFSTLKLEVGFEAGPLHLRESLLHWINDGLMALFFLLVGLEIKREMLDGQLRGLARIALPGLAALGGMIVPALVYLVVNHANATGLRGWAIPTATDIAFALGVLALAGPRVPISLKIFLTALAIIDDLGAILIIAVAYTADLDLVMLALAAGLIVLLVVFNRAGVTRLTPYLLTGAVLWYVVLQSGVHATLAGVALALTIPLRASPGRPDDTEPSSTLHRLEHRLHKPVGFLIVPLFGFANAGVAFAGMHLGQILDPVPLGIALGLFLGKQAGVFGALWLAVRLNLADDPRDATRAQIYGTALLCGIGFTMSLFIGNLAFADPQLIDETKIGVFLGSLLSALAGLAVLRRAPATTGAEP